jgi:hypothetical protein
MRDARRKTTTEKLRAREGPFLDDLGSRAEHPIPLECKSLGIWPRGNVIVRNDPSKSLKTGTGDRGDLINCQPRRVIARTTPKIGRHADQCTSVLFFVVQRPLGGFRSAWQAILADTLGVVHE